MLQEVLPIVGSVIESGECYREWGELQEVLPIVGSVIESGESYRKCYR